VPLLESGELTSPFAPALQELHAHCSAPGALAAALAGHPHLHTLHLTAITTAGRPAGAAAEGRAWPRGALSAIPGLRCVQLRALLPPGQAQRGLVEDLAGCRGLEALELAAPGEEWAGQLAQLPDAAAYWPPARCSGGRGRGAAIGSWGLQRLAAGASAGSLRRLVLGRAWAAAGRGRSRGVEGVGLAEVGQLLLGSGALPKLEACAVAVGQAGGQGGWGEVQRHRQQQGGGASGGGGGQPAGRGCCWGSWMDCEEGMHTGGQPPGRVGLTFGAMQAVFCPEELVLLAGREAGHCH
jgi:hypothetical protein